MSAPSLLQGLDEMSGPALKERFVVARKAAAAARADGAVAEAETILASALRAGIRAMVLAASPSAACTAFAAAPPRRLPIRRSASVAAPASSARKPGPAKPSPSGPALLGACGSRVATSGRYRRSQFSASRPSGSTISASPWGSARPAAPSAARSSARSRPSL